mmetsp:Transcript_17286/g.2860  ORF Transcript_17286/g.2860 Transcript_17286/m.2860 type:complete len:150 (-) Transcript_17286:456-905(-)
MIKEISAIPEIQDTNFRYFFFDTENSSTNISDAEIYKKVPVEILRIIPYTTYPAISYKTIPKNMPIGPLNAKITKTIKLIFEFSLLKLKESAKDSGILCISTAIDKLIKNYSLSCSPIAAPSKKLCKDKAVAKTITDTVLFCYLLLTNG